MHTSLLSLTPTHTSRTHTYLLGAHKACTHFHYDLSTAATCTLPQCYQLIASLFVSSFFLPCFSVFPSPPPCGSVPRYSYYLGLASKGGISVAFTWSCHSIPPPPATVGYITGTDWTFLPCDLSKGMKALNSKIA